MGCARPRDMDPLALCRRYERAGDARGKPGWWGRRRPTLRRRWCSRVRCIRALGDGAGLAEAAVGVGVGRRAGGGGEWRCSDTRPRGCPPCGAGSCARAASRLPRPYLPSHTSGRPLKKFQQPKQSEKGPRWVKDKAVFWCKCCNTDFSVVVRKHHCRHCGHVFCGHCCSNKRTLIKYGYLKPVRLCNKCNASCFKADLLLNAVGLNDINTVTKICEEVHVHVTTRLTPLAEARLCLCPPVSVCVSILCVCVCVCVCV